jgi:hypothetical protein
MLYNLPNLLRRSGVSGHCFNGVLMSKGIVADLLPNLERTGRVSGRSVISTCHVFSLLVQNPKWRRKLLS